MLEESLMLCHHLFILKCHFLVLLCCIGIITVLEFIFSSIKLKIQSRDMWIDLHVNPNNGSDYPQKYLILFSQCGLSDAATHLFSDA